jgi:hypothetical protein
MYYYLDSTLVRLRTQRVPIALLDTNGLAVLVNQSAHSTKLVLSNREANGQKRYQYLSKLAQSQKPPRKPWIEQLGSGAASGVARY